MRIGIVVDSACDLPDEYRLAQAITVLPIRVLVDDANLLDDRDPAVRRQFFEQKLGTRSHGAVTEPWTVEQIRALFLERLVVDYDCVFCLTITSTRSPIYDNATEAAFAILSDYRPIRHAAGVPGPFLMRVIDSENLFAAQGITAVEAVRLRERGEHPGQIRERLEMLARNTWGYVVARDLHYLRARARKKGDRSVGWLSAALGSALDVKPILRAWRGETAPIAKVRGYEAAAQMLFRYAVRRVNAGLLSPTLCLSYGGELDEMRALDGYSALRETCVERGVELFEAPMSLTGMVNLGVGALSLGLAAEDHPFEA